MPLISLDEKSKIKIQTSADGKQFVVFADEDDCCEFVERLGLSAEFACCDGYMNAFVLPPLR